MLDVLDLLGSLVDKSLVVADHSPQMVRYRLLETIRQYSAQELLRASGDAEVLHIRGRHAGYYLEMAKVGRPATLGPDQGQWLRRFDAEWDNLRGAFAHFTAEDRGDEVMELAVSLRRFSLSRGHHEVLDFVRPVVDKPGVAPSALRADAMTVAGQLIGMLSRTDAAEMAAAREYAERALAMAQDVGDRRVEAHALSNLAESAFAAGELETGHRLAGQGVAIARELGDLQLLGEQLQGLALTAPSRAERVRIHEEELACSRQAGDDMLVVGELNNRFGLEMHSGQIDEASASLEEAIVRAERLGGDLILHFLRCNLALLRLIQSRYAEAASLVRNCLLTSRRLGPGVGSGELIFAAACVATWQGDDLRAARLTGAGDADIDASLAIRTINWSEAEQSLREREQGRLRERLGDAVYEEAYRSGAELTASQALNLALGRDAHA